MSDTSKTDAKTGDLLSADPQNCWQQTVRYICDLERENAALREQLQHAKVENNHNWQFQSIHEETLKENAALRDLLQESLEWLDDYGMRMSGTSNLVSRIEKALE